MYATARRWFRNLRTSSWTSLRRRPGHKKARQSRKLFVEILEDRTLLAGSIMGSVWNDLQPDGTRLPGEPGLAGVTVFLDQNGNHQQTTTSGDGRYSFTDLAPGSYNVGIVVPDGAALTFPGGGVNVRNVGVGPDQAVQGVDFGVLAAPGIPGNQFLTNDSAAQQMPSVAVDPHDANHVVIAYMDYGVQNNGFAVIRVAVSRDGGATWKKDMVPLQGDFSQAAGNPVVQFDDQGHFYVTYMAATFKGTDSLGNPLVPGLIYDTSNTTIDGVAVSRRAFGMRANNGVFVAQASDDAQGNVTWNHNTAVASHLFAGTKVFFETLPDIAIDTNAASPNHGNIYVTWTRFYPSGQFPGRPAFKGGSDAMIAVSKDGGLTWETQLQPKTRGGVPVQVSAVLDPLVGGSDGSTEGRGQSGGPSHVTVGPEGYVYVSIFAGGRFPVFVSTDGGHTFPHPNLTDAINVVDYPFGNDANPPPNFPLVFPTPASRLAHDTFRTLSVRDIVADPAHPGRLYAVEAIQIPNVNTQSVIDAAEINFSVSNDNGQTWSTMFTVGSNPSNFGEVPAGLEQVYRSPVNDDGGGRFLGFDTPEQLLNEVISGQALPRMSVDEQGNVTIIWYDTRRDPADHSLDVFGATSTDGGHSFSANYRITSQSFDPNVGAPHDGAGNPYIGDLIGLASANGQVYAAWTDSSAGNQEIGFARYALNPAPVPLNDRFEPNDTPQTATNLGVVAAQKVVPRLTMDPSDNDWFKLTAAATGDLVVTVSAATAGSALHLELWDADGTNKLATGMPVTDQGAQVIGQQISFHGEAGKQYQVHVSGGIVPLYSLVLQSLTKDFGTTVQGSADGTIDPGAQALYRLVTAVGGSLDVTLDGAGLTLQALSPDGQVVLAEGSHISLPTDQGQVFLLRVKGMTAASTGAFHLQFVNLDIFETPQPTSLFFPAAGAPSGIAAADLNRDGKVDLAVSSNRFTDALSVLLGNGNGTFQAGRPFDTGPGIVPEAVREPVVADLNGDKIPDLVVSNFSAASVSVLLGRGDGTYDTVRTFDATAQPDSVAVGDFNGDKKLDLVVLSRPNDTVKLAYLFGRGDGTFKPPVVVDTPFQNNAYPVRAGDLNKDGKTDLVVFGSNADSFQVYMGQANGTPTAVNPPVAAGESMYDARLADVNGDGKLDVIVGGGKSGTVYVHLGNGNGTFQAPLAFRTITPGPGDNIGVFSLNVVDYAGSNGTGPADNHADIVVTVASRFSSSPPQLMLLPGLVDGSGKFAGFGPAQRLATLKQAGQVTTADFNADGSKDIAVTDKGGVRVIYGKPPVIASNTTVKTARNLGVVTHMVSPPQAIVTGHQDAYFAITVPTEAAKGTGNQVIDISALFENVQGAGLQMEVLDATGKKVLASGERIRMLAAQGQKLIVHVFGLPPSGALARGAGVYTLDIDVLPQIVSAEAPTLVSGGTATSIVLTLQGDRLDPATAEDPANYKVTFLGVDGLAGTADDKVMTIASLSGGQPIIYNPGSNVKVGSGQTTPTAVKQTITLLFKDPLPVGSYEIDVANVQAAPYNDDEAGLLTAQAGVNGHALVSRPKKAILEGSKFLAFNLVPPLAPANSFADLAAGNRFLTQLHDDMGAQLNAGLRLKGDTSAITDALLKQILDKFAGQTGLLILWFDPVSIDLVDPKGDRATFDLNTNQLSNTVSRTFIEVGGNVEVMVLAGVSGSYTVNLSDVQPSARAGAVLMGNTAEAVAMTDALRGGQHQFTFEFNDAGAGTGTGTSGVSTAFASVDIGGIGGSFTASNLPTSNLATDLTTASQDLARAGSTDTGGAVSRSSEGVGLSSIATALITSTIVSTVQVSNYRQDLGGGEDDNPWWMPFGDQEDVAPPPGPAQDEARKGGEDAEWWRIYQDSDQPQAMRPGLDDLFRQLPELVSEPAAPDQAIADVAQDALALDGILAWKDPGMVQMPTIGLRGSANDLMDTLLWAGKSTAAALAERMAAVFEQSMPTRAEAESTTPETPVEQGSTSAVIEETGSTPLLVQDRDQGAALLTAVFAAGVGLTHASNRPSDRAEKRRKPGWPW